ncbi:hypothetical protein [Hafnia paralvei]|uniref:SpaN/EivJ family type III secretion system needle length determinant n=1 Tax=Hafnia paralvei TaxID=546367 RepID=UPI00300D1DCE
MAIKVDASNTRMKTSNKDTKFDIESLVRSKHKKEKKHYSGDYSGAKFAHNHPEPAFLQTGHLLQQNTPSSTGQSGEAFSHLKRTAMFSRSGSVSKLKGALPAGGNTTAEVKNNEGQKTPQNPVRPALDDKHSSVHFSPERQPGAASGLDKSEFPARQVQLKARDNKLHLQSGETSPVLDKQPGTQEAKAAETEQPTGQATAYQSDVVQVKDPDSVNIEYRFSRWQGDHSVTFTTTAGTMQPDALLMYPSSQRVMETLHAHTGDWNGDKPLIVLNSDEDTSQKQSGGRQQQNDEDES